MLSIQHRATFPEVVTAHAVTVNSLNAAVCNKARLEVSTVLSILTEPSFLKLSLHADRHGLAPRCVGRGPRRPIPRVFVSTQPEPTVTKPLDVRASYWNQVHGVFFIRTHVYTL